MNNLPTISNNLPSSAKSTPKTQQGLSNPVMSGGAKPPASRPPEGGASGDASFTMAGNAASAASGNASNASWASNKADDKTVASQGSDTQPVESFAALLARQINETDPLTLDAAQIAIAIKDKTTGDSAKPGIKETPEQAEIATGTPIDQANTLAAILLQLPQEIRTPVTSDAASNPATPSTGNNKTPGIDIATLEAASLSDSAVARPDIAKLGMTRPDMAKPDLTKPDLTKPGMAKPDLAKPDMRGTVSEKVEASAIVADKQIISDALNLETAKRVEPATGQPQSSPGVAQSITSPAMSSVMPNMLTGNNVTGAPQSIATPLGNNGWADDFSQKITWMSTQRNQVAELHLNPPDLGPLNVVLKISDNQATALFTSPHSAVRDAVENAIPKLRELLADNGIMLGNATVSDQSPRDRGADEFMNRGLSTAAQRETSDDALKSATLSLSQNVPMHSHNGMADTFA